MKRICILICFTTFITTAFTIPVEKCNLTVSSTCPFKLDQETFTICTNEPPPTTCAYNLNRFTTTTEKTPPLTIREEIAPVFKKKGCCTTIKLQREILFPKTVKAPKNARKDKAEKKKEKIQQEDLYFSKYINKRILKKSVGKRFAGDGIYIPLYANIKFNKRNSTRSKKLNSKTLFQTHKKKPFKTIKASLKQATTVPSVVRRSSTSTLRAAYRKSERDKALKEAEIFRSLQENTPDRRTERFLIGSPITCCGNIKQPILSSTEAVGSDGLNKLISGVDQLPFIWSDVNEMFKEMNNNIGNMELTTKNGKKLNDIKRLDMKSIGSTTRATLTNQKKWFDTQTEDSDNDIWDVLRIKEHVNPYYSFSESKTLPRNRIGHNRSTAKPEHNNKRMKNLEYNKKDFSKGRADILNAFFNPVTSIFEDAGVVSDQLTTPIANYLQFGHIGTSDNEENKVNVNKELGVYQNTESLKFFRGSKNKEIHQKDKKTDNLFEEIFGKENMTLDEGTGKYDVFTFGTVPDIMKFDRLYHRDEEILTEKDSRVTSKNNVQSHSKKGPQKDSKAFSKETQIASKEDLEDDFSDTLRKAIEEATKDNFVDGTKAPTKQTVLEASSTKETFLEASYGPTIESLHESLKNTSFKFPQKPVKDSSNGISQIPTNETNESFLEASDGSTIEPSVSSQEKSRNNSLEFHQELIKETSNEALQIPTQETKDTQNPEVLQEKSQEASQKLSQDTSQETSVDPQESQQWYGSQDSQDASQGSGTAQESYAQNSEVPQNIEPTQDSEATETQVQQDTQEESQDDSQQIQQYSQQIQQYSPEMPQTNTEEGDLTYFSSAQNENAKNEENPTTKQPQADDYSGSDVSTNSEDKPSNIPTTQNTFLESNKMVAVLSAVSLGTTTTPSKVPYTQVIKKKQKTTETSKSSTNPPLQRPVSVVTTTRQSINPNRKYQTMPIDNGSEKACIIFTFPPCQKMRSPTIPSVLVEGLEYTNTATTTDKCGLNGSTQPTEYDINMTKSTTPSSPDDKKKVFKKKKKGAGSIIKVFKQSIEPPLLRDVMKKRKGYSLKILFQQEM